ncbi:MAG: chorismate mutase [Egibacteraceae bacterium]
MSLERVRVEIDDIDRQIVTLIAQRTEWVRRVVDCKSSTSDIIVPEREAEVLANVRKFAAELGADVDVVEKIYRALLAAFVEFEFRHIMAER